MKPVSVLALSAQVRFTWVALTTVANKVRRCSWWDNPECRHGDLSSGGFDRHRRIIPTVAHRIQSQDPVLIGCIGLTAVSAKVRMPVVFSWSRGDGMFSRSTQVPELFVILWTRWEVSAIELSFQVRFTTELLASAAKPFGLTGGRATETGSHHIHLFVRKDMAVIDILPTEVDKLVDDIGGGIALYIDIVEHRCRSGRHHWVEHANCIRQFPGNFRMMPQSDNCVLKRSHTYGVLPSQFIRFRWDDDIVPRHPVDKLHIVQVEVDRMRIDTIVSDAPDLRSVSRI